MRSTGYGGLIDCPWHEIKYYSHQTESDFQRMGKLGGGLLEFVLLRSNTSLSFSRLRYIW